MRVSKRVFCEVLLGFVVAVPLAQTRAAAVTPAPVYDVVSIKVNHSGSGSMDMDVSNGTYSAKNISLRMLLQSVYDMRRDLISGVPGPIDSARFDVEAKVVEPDPEAFKKMSEKERRAMLEPGLRERFQLKTHTEIKTLPVYELVVLPGGAKIKESSSEGKGHTGMGINNNRELTATDIPMESLAKALSDVVHKTVIDKTGLTGRYDLTLKWARDESPESTETVPGLFTAIREQLGLKLQAGKGPVETLVVDHVEMTTEN